MSKALMTIPLCDLQRARENVRKTEPNMHIDALAALIDAQGLLQNLVVRPAAGNGRERHYEVVAGGRRLQALKLLARRRRIPRDFKVPCKLVEPQRATDVEVSLAENIGQAPLHPADQFEAFSKLHDQGLGAGEIAARCGVSQKVVEQRLKLAAVSPRLMAVYREGGMTLEQLTAFTISDDHAAQEQVWLNAPLADTSPEGIRRALTHAHVQGSDRRARFVGTDAYEAAGGTVIRDLFDPDAAYFTDSVLLDGLTGEKLEAEAQKVRSEGWSWVEVRPELDYEEQARFGRIPPTQLRLPKKERQKLKAASKRHDALVAKLEREEDDAASAELDQLEKEIEERTQRFRKWSDKDKARAGAVLSLDFNGALIITRGLVREQEQRSASRSKAIPEEGAKAADNGHSDALLRNLSAHRTAALREALAGQPDVALTALVHSLAWQTFFGASGEPCVGVRPIFVDLAPLADGIGESPAVAGLAERHAGWAQRVPASEGLWSWLVEQSLETRLDLLAYLVACTVNATWQRYDRDQRGRLAQADRLADATGLDMSRWWRATQRSYLNRASKRQIVQAVSEAVSPQAGDNMARMKKTAMAAKAEELLADTGWLPESLRVGRQAE
jgi:ParB family chromosome partitioning protein